MLTIFSKLCGLQDDREAVNGPHEASENKKDDLEVRQLDPAPA